MRIVGSKFCLFIINFGNEQEINKQEKKFKARNPKSEIRNIISRYVIDLTYFWNIRR
jgi:hypothetical protein